MLPAVVRSVRRGATTTVGLELDRAEPWQLEASLALALFCPRITPPIAES